MKIRPVGAELFHTDGRTDRQTDMTKLIASFRNFANTPKIYVFNLECNIVGVYAVLYLRNNTFMRNGGGELCRKTAARLTANFDDNIKKILVE
jgi:hypothetical protein